jgi:hypothetical protein
MTHSSFRTLLEFQTDSWHSIKRYVLLPPYPSISFQYEQQTEILTYVYIMHHCPKQPPPILMPCCEDWALPCPLSDVAVGAQKALAPRAVSPVEILSSPAKVVEPNPLQKNIESHMGSSNCKTCQTWVWGRETHLGYHTICLGWTCHSTGLRKKTGNQMLSLRFSRTHVDWDN